MSAPYDDRASYGDDGPPTEQQRLAEEATAYMAAVMRDEEGQDDN